MNFRVTLPHYSRFFSLVYISRVPVNSEYFNCNTLLYKLFSQQNLLCLQVEFKEEYDMHLGGVIMEFFHLLAKELQKAELQILEVNEYGVAWFSKNVRINKWHFMLFYHN